MRLFLHIGAGKTGTSVIQSTLARHREALAQSGLWYPKGDDISEVRAGAGEMNNGNGGLLARYAFPDRRNSETPRNAVATWLSRVTREAAGRDIVISSESLQLIREETLAEFDKMVRVRGMELRVIFYMRHLLDVHVTTFAQFAKLGLLASLPPERRSLDGYVATASTTWPRQLRGLQASLGKERVVTRLYDADRADLVGRFLGLIGPDHARALPAATSGEVVNRSPNLVEFRLLEAINTVAEPKVARSLCRDLSNALLNAPAVVAAPGLHVSEQAYAAFAKREAPVVEAVNREHLPPETPLKLSSGRIPIGTPAPVAEAEMAEVSATAMLRLAAASRRPAAPRRAPPRRAQAEQPAT